jgi:hypothetical protein
MGAGRWCRGRDWAGGSSRNLSPLRGPPSTHTRTLALMWSHSASVRKPLYRKALGFHDRCTTSPRHSSCDGAAARPAGRLAILRLPAHQTHHTAATHGSSTRYSRTSFSPMPNSELKSIGGGATAAAQAASASQQAQAAPSAAARSLAIVGTASRAYMF